MSYICNTDIKMMDLWWIESCRNHHCF